VPDNNQANPDENWENEPDSKYGDDYTDALNKTSRANPDIGPDNSLRSWRGRRDSQRDRQISENLPAAKGTSNALASQLGGDFDGATTGWAFHFEGVAHVSWVGMVERRDFRARPARTDP
jgi:hypothetical protein